MKILPWIFGTLHITSSKTENEEPQGNWYIRGSDWPSTNGMELDSNGKIEVLMKLLIMFFQVF